MNRWLASVGVDENAAPPNTVFDLLLLVEQSSHSRKPPATP